MSESEAPMGKAINVKEATESSGQQFSKESSAPPLDKSGPDLSNMTGSEAKAYVESEKKKLEKSPQTAKDAIKEVSIKKVSQVSEREEIKEAIRKHKVKVDGQDLEVDEEELKRGYSHQRAANKILQEGKTARKQAEEFINMMKDPEKFWDVAKRLGHDDRKMAEERLGARLQEEMMDPRDRELRDAKLRVKEFEDRETIEKDRIEKQRSDILKDKYAKEYTEQFTQALSESQLPPTKAMVAEMARYIQRSAKIGFQMTAHEAAKLVKEDLLEAQKRLIGNSDGETLIKLLGQETANKIRQYDTNKLRNPEQNLRTPEVQGEVRERKPRDKRMTSAEWRDFNRK